MATVTITITLYRMKLRETNADQAHRTHGRAARAAALEYDLLAPPLPDAYLLKTQLNVAGAERLAAAAAAAGAAER